MFCLNDTMHYFLCPGKTDMRKGINSLCGVVHDRMDMTSVWAMSSSHKQKQDHHEAPPC